MLETWFFYKAIVLLPLTKKWRLGRETSYSNSVGAISRAYFFCFQRFPLPASHPSPGRTRDSLFTVWRAMGGLWAASEWPRLGGQRSPQPPSCGPQELGGPRGSLENRTSPSAFLQALARGEGEGPPSRLPPPPSPSAIRLHRPRKH